MPTRNSRQTRPTYIDPCRVKPANKSFRHNRWRSSGNSFQAVPLSSRSNNLSKNRGCNSKRHGCFRH
ncbi:hypothetical protein HanPSC8_Chr15g0692261 [Helianthus annuus]|nr:hypothetical protein HanPSC8_Chr15g0692261 [Helianthus annuus]